MVFPRERKGERKGVKRGRAGRGEEKRKDFPLKMIPVFFLLDLLYTPPKALNTAPIKLKLVVALLTFSGCPDFLRT